MTVKAVDFAYAEWDYVPTPGEAIVIRRIETDETFLKIGDGKRRLSDLPIISPKLEECMANYEKTCAQCEHLCVINRNKIYAVCDEFGKVFELWKMDTRATDAEHCIKFIPVNDGYGDKEV